jgi:hypothetical protein
MDASRGRAEAQTLKEGGKPMYAPSPHVTPLVFRNEIQIANKCKKM